jgi:hypothetical protein
MNIGLGLAQCPQSRGSFRRGRRPRAAQRMFRVLIRSILTYSGSPALRAAGTTLLSTHSDLARKRLTPDPLIAELKSDLDAAQHLLHEIVIAFFRREHDRDPPSKAEYRAYCLSPKCR